MVISLVPPTALSDGGTDGCTFGGLASVLLCSFSLEADWTELSWTSVRPEVTVTVRVRVRVSGVEEGRARQVVQLS